MTQPAVVVINGTLPGEGVDEVRRLLDASDAEMSYVVTTESDPGVGPARDAAEDGVELVIAYGGDGTVRACAEGIRGTPTALAVIPAGTGNLLARNLGIPDDPPAAITVAITGRTRVLDTGRVNGELFAVMAGAGFDAEVMDGTDHETKERVGSLAYVLEGARHLNDPSFEATIIVDDAELARDEWTTVLVGNLGRLQGNVAIFPDSSPDDGVLHILGIMADSVGERLAAGWEAVSGDGVGEHVLRATGRNVRLESTKPVRYELDGDPRSPTTELGFEVRPGSLRLRVPEESA